jgi:endonuclease/exonuclease/phosphatase family metal-dependent hydrolase
VGGSEQEHEITAHETRALANDLADPGVTVAGRVDAGPRLRIASWNINNRVGRTRFRPDAAQAAMALDADVIVFEEFFASSNLERFLAELRDGGWKHQVMSNEPSIKANRILIASRVPIEPLILPASTVDEHLTANVAGAVLPGSLALLGVRVPTYRTDELARAWAWLGNVADGLLETFHGKAVIVGDLNTQMNSVGRNRMDEFHRMMAAGWTRATPSGIGSYFSPKGIVSEIDHVLVGSACQVRDARFVSEIGGHKLAGTAAGAISDHAALVFELTELPSVWA